MTLKHTKEVSVITSTFLSLRTSFFHKTNKQFSTSTPIVINAIAKHYQSTSDPLTISRLAEKTSLTTAAISQILNPLEEHRLVCREKSDTDRRQTYITLTRKGKHMLGKFTGHKRHTEFLDELLEYLGPEDSASLVHLCTRISDFMSVRGEKEVVPE